jgi:hypothetical protein
VVADVAAGPDRESLAERDGDGAVAHRGGHSAPERGVVPQRVGRVAMRVIRPSGRRDRQVLTAEARRQVNELDRREPEDGLVL